jgi:hypothetical protein
MASIYDGKRLNVIAGDIPEGLWEYDNGVLYKDRDIGKAATATFDLMGLLSNVSLQTEQSVKKLSGTLGWGLAGAVALGPIGMLAGLVMGGNRKEVCALCDLKDGRKFLATMDNKIFQQLLALSMKK